MTIQNPTKTVDVRSLYRTREVVAYRHGGLFPVLTVAPDESIVAVLRGGAGHLGIDGRIDIIRSRDVGQTWTYPNIVADTEKDDRNPGFGTSAAGTLVLSYARASSYNEDGSYFPCKPEDANKYWNAVVTRSHDSGLTWEDPYPQTYAPLRSCSPFGKMVNLPDGTLLMPLYGITLPDLVGNRMSQMIPGDSCAYLLRSHDDGLTWGEPSIIAINGGEPAVTLLPNGELLALVRRERMGKTLWSTYSADGGLTWTEPEQVTGDMRHPADLIVLSDDSVLLTYGNRNSPPTRVEGLISRDGGHSWLDCLLVFSGNLRGYNSDFPRRVDLGYPSTVMSTGIGPRTGVTMYYYNPSIAPTDNLRQTSTSYSAQNYCAIAVVWDEADLIEAVDLAIRQ